MSEATQTPKAPQPTQTYEGGCHCGAVRYRVTMAAPTKATTCNCSLCARAGWLLAFTPAAGFELLQGEAQLRDYQFGGKTLHHRFCETCGVRSFSAGPSPDGTQWVSINLRCLDDFDVADLPLESFDGAAL